jgi:hypothetical protein
MIDDFSWGMILGWFGGTFMTAAVVLLYIYCRNRKQRHGVN